MAAWWIVTAPAVGLLGVGAIILFVTSARSLSRLALMLGVVSIAWAGIAGLITAYVTLFGERVTVDVPLRPFTPHAAAGIELGSRVARITGGGVDHAELELSGLSAAPRILLASSTLLQTAVIVLLALIVVRLARAISAGDPFRAGGRSLSAAAVVVGVGGVAWSVLGQLGGWLAGQDALAMNSWSASLKQVPGIEAVPGENALAQYGWPSPADFRLDLPFWPIAAAIALALVAAAFRAGVRLRRDTEGLV